MFKGSNFDICVLRSTAEALNCQMNDRDVEVLRGVHCVNWGSMSPESRLNIKLLCCQLLGIELSEVEAEEFRKQHEPLKVTLSKEATTLMVQEDIAAIKRKPGLVGAIWEKLKR